VHTITRPWPFFSISPSDDVSERVANDCAGRKVRNELQIHENGRTRDPENIVAMLWLKCHYEINFFTFVMNPIGDVGKFDVAHTKRGEGKIL